MALIRDPRALLEALRRLRAANDAVVFWNADHTLKLMLRNDPGAVDVDDKDAVGWDLSIVWDSDDEDDDSAPRMRRVAALDSDGVLEDPGTLVMDSGLVASVSEAAADPDDEHSDLGRCVAALNAAYCYAVCPCGAYLIKDGGDACLFCLMTSTPADSRRQFCAICQSDGTVQHMVRQGCCRQYLHRSCLAAWACRCAASPGGASPSCPLCRAS
jgi:hypothetical protein